MLISFFFFFFFLSCVCKVVFSSFIELVSVTFCDVVFLILWSFYHLATVSAVLLPIKLPVAFAVFLFTLFEAVLKASVAILGTPDFSATLHVRVALSKYFWTILLARVADLFARKTTLYLPIKFLLLVLLIY